MLLNIYKQKILFSRNLTCLPLTQKATTENGLYTPRLHPVELNSPSPLPSLYQRGWLCARPGWGTRVRQAGPAQGFPLPHTASLAASHRPGNKDTLPSNLTHTLAHKRTPQMTPPSPPNISFISPSFSLHHLTSLFLLSFPSLSSLLSAPSIAHCVFILVLLSHRNPLQEQSLRDTSLIIHWR